jgi:hypothetical protein
MGEDALCIQYEPVKPDILKIRTYLLNGGLEIKKKRVDGSHLRSKASPKMLI